MSTHVVLITGALTGIGRAAAVAFAKEGGERGCSGRRDEAGQVLVKELHSLGSRAEFVHADVRTEDRGALARRQDVARFGRLDVAVTMPARRPEPARSPINGGKLRRDVRHECSRRNPEHEARGAHHAGTGQRQHHQHLVDLRARGGGGRLHLCRQQARGRGYHQVCGAEIAQVGNPCKRRGARPVGPACSTRFHGHAGEKDGAGDDCPMGRLGVSEELPTRSSSSRRTKLHSSLAMSSTSTEARPPADSNSHSRFIGSDFARVSTIYDPTPDQRAAHIKWRRESNGQRGQEIQHFF